jgi:hypothetical protein
MTCRTSCGSSMPRWGNTGDDVVMTRRLVREWLTAGANSGVASERVSRIACGADRSPSGVLPRARGADRSSKGVFRVGRVAS